MTKQKLDLRSPIYHDDNAAREHLEALYWPNGATCPKCGVSGDRVTKLQGKSTRPGVYKCKDCRKPFSVTIGTVMERSHVPLSKWVMAAQLMASSKKGFSALQLQRMLGTNYETAWFLFHRLRECADTPSSTPMGGSGQIVEADETFIGGKEKNKHVGKRNRKNIGGAGKQIAFALVERGGRVRSKHVPSVTAATLRPILKAHLEADSFLVTDDAGQYRHMHKDFRHETVNHSNDEYVRGEVHTNSVEGYFSILKRGIIGTFHHVSQQHLQRYLNEFDFRYNTRKISDAERADALLSGGKGKRLLYQGTNQAEA